MWYTLYVLGKWGVCTSNLVVEIVSYSFKGLIYMCLHSLILSEHRHCSHSSELASRRPACARGAPALLSNSGVFPLLLVPVGCYTIPNYNCSRETKLYCSEISIVLIALALLCVGKASECLPSLVHDLLFVFLPFHW